MSQPGLGVMLKMLGGNDESSAAERASLGKTIAAMALVDDALVIRFDDGTGLKLADEGQSCCESRYMTTDGEDFSYYFGASYMGAETREAPQVVDNEYDIHDVEFLVILTSRGELVFSSHNEHNGYYGGFCIRASALGEDASR